MTQPKYFRKKEGNAKVQMFTGVYRAAVKKTMWWKNIEIKLKNTGEKYPNKSKDNSQRPFLKLNCVDISK